MDLFKIVSVNDIFYVRQLCYDNTAWKPWVYKYVSLYLYSSDLIEHARGFSKFEDAQKWINEATPK